jgi:tetratricopeptide (TPR) repeat protein
MSGTEKGTSQSIGTRGPAVRTRRVAAVSQSEFDDDTQRQRFYTALQQAQDALLRGATAEAERLCVGALRIKPHPQVFVVLETLCEQKGDFAKAREFRLLHAYMARDPVKWKELYQDYLEAGEFHRAAVCLKRLIPLSKEPTERRQLTIDRADLLVGLGELKQAATAYEELWQRSGYADFEVFGKLSELYFQLGRTNALLHTTGKAKAALARARNVAAAVPAATPQSDVTSQEQREDAVSAPVKLRRGGEAIQFSTQGYISLVNVEMEIALERGLYDEAVRSAHEAAQLLDVRPLDLPPDVLVRLGIAHAYQGDKTAALAAFHVITSSSDGDGSHWATDFGDTLYDAAEALLSVGWAEEALDLLDAMVSASVELNIAAVHHSRGRCLVRLGRLSDAKAAFDVVLATEPHHARTRIALARMALELGDTPLARSYALPREEEDAFDTVLLRECLSEVEFLAGEYVRCIEAALPVVRILDVHVDDEESIATGGSRRRTSVAQLPSVVRSSSAIIPAASLALLTGTGSGAGSFVGRGGGSLVAGSIAASFNAALTARSSLALAKHGTVAASSIAASTAAGAGRAASGEVFRFKRSRKQEDSAETLKRGRDDNLDESPSGTQHACRSQPAARGNDVRDIANLDDLDDLDDGSTSHDASAAASPLGLVERDAEGFALPDPRPAGGNDAGDGALPELEDIASQFEDPEMASLFLQATMGRSSTSAPNTGDAAAGDASGLAELDPAYADHAGKLDEFAKFAEARRLTMASQVTAMDLYRLMGLRAIHALLQRCIDAYERLGQFVDGKDLAQWARVRVSRLPNKRTQLNRDTCANLARQHLRLSIIAGDTRAAISNAVHCLEDLKDSAPDDPDVLRVWGFVARIVASGDRSKILQRLVGAGAGGRAADAMLAVVCGHSSFQTRYYGAAARCYWAALGELPHDAQLNLLLACCFVYLVGRKNNSSDARHRFATHAFAFIERYGRASAAAAARDPLVRVEVAYNGARLNAYLGLAHLAIPLYEEALAAITAIESWGSWDPARAVAQGQNDSAAAQSGEARAQSQQCTPAGIALRRQWVVGMRRAAAHGLALLYRRPQVELESMKVRPQGIQDANEVLRRHSVALTL